MLELHECKSVTNLHQGHLNESRREDHERASSYKLDDLFLPQKICTTFLQEFHLSLVWNFWNGSMRYVRVSVKEDSKRFKIILKTGSRVKTCKRESIVLSDRYYRMDSCSSKGDNNRAKRHYPSPPLSFRYRNESVRVPPFLGILLRGTKSTPIFNLSNTVSIIIPPIYDSLMIK